jgi:hypothetical protein
MIISPDIAGEEYIAIVCTDRWTVRPFDCAGSAVLRSGRGRAGEERVVQDFQEARAIGANGQNRAVRGERDRHVGVIGPKFDLVIPVAEAVHVRGPRSTVE